MNTSRSSRNTAVAALALVILAYLLAFGAAIGTGFALRGYSMTVIAIVGDVAATLMVYIFGRIFHNSSLYDPYWSVAPIVIAIYWLISAENANWPKLIILVLVCLWGLRLTWNWARGWRGLKHEDWRYADLRSRTRRWFWLVELLGIDFMPTFVVFLGCLSLYPALTEGRPASGILNILAVSVTALAIIIEAVSDAQLRQFVEQRRHPEDIMESGLWAYCRHPNYLGEIMFWWGLYLFALASDLRYWWTAMGPLAITALFVFISIPMMDRHIEERHAGYRQRRQDVPALLPRFSRS